MADSVNVPDRGALYYPNIHFKSVEWLKATLLAFGHVHRIVPVDYPLDRDVDAVKAVSERHLRETASANGPAARPLVFEVDPDWNEIEQAQGRLSQGLAQAIPSDLRQRFGREAAQSRESEGGRFEIHESKINIPLLAQLRQADLAWPAEEGGPWVRVHPDLGQAIMGTTAIAAAKRTGSEVVTDSAALHTALAALDENALLGQLLGASRESETELPSDRATGQLAHAVLSTRFDLRQLSMDRVAGLVRDGADLRAFRQHLKSFAELLPPEIGQEERDRRLAELSDEVMNSWREFEKRVPKGMLAAFKASVADGCQDLVKTAAGATAASAFAAGGLLHAIGSIGAPVVLAALIPAGVPIVFKLIKAGLKLHAEHTQSGPFKFLARIEASGGMQLAVPRSLRVIE